MARSAAPRVTAGAPVLSAWRATFKAMAAAVAMTQAGGVGLLPSGLDAEQRQCVRMTPDSFDGPQQLSGREAQQQIE